MIQRVKEQWPCLRHGVHCALAESVPLFISMGAHSALKMLVQSAKCSDRKEEYKLWKLMRRQRTRWGGRRPGDDDNKWGL